jgi:hypothetical protein
MKPNRITAVILSMFMTSSISLDAQESILQSWTSSDGKVIQAKFIKLEGDYVTLEVGGQQHKFPLARLSPESMALAKKLGGVVPAPPPPSATITPTGTGSTISPNNLIGKTFEECEIILGKPARVEDPEGERRSFARYYKPSAPGIVQIKLERLPEGSMAGPVSGTVNNVSYQYPKGTVKTVREAFKLAELSYQDSYSHDFKDLTGDEALPSDDSMPFQGVSAGKLNADWRPAAANAKMPERFRLADDDHFIVGKQVGPTMREMRDQTRRKFALMKEFPDLYKNGAFGFPQASATVLADQQEARFSVWSNAEFLFVQILVWADDDDSLAKNASGQDMCDISSLFLNLDVQRTDGVITDRTYYIAPKPELHGLHYRLRGDQQGTPPLMADSKGRGSIQFVPSGGKKLRVDSFLIPLAEIGKKSGDMIRLSLSGHSVAPQVSFNSAGLRDRSGRAFSIIAQKKSEYHDFTLGQQSGTIDPSLVPDGRNK